MTAGSRETMVGQKIMQRAGRRGGVVLATLALLVAACSSSPGDENSDADGSDGAVADGAAVPCDQGATQDEVTAEPVEGIPSDLTITSFDDTKIRAHWFPVADASADKPAPTVLMGPGWSLPGDTSQEGAVLFGALSISGLHEAGYNVLTWDPRGFGESTGTVQVNAADAEGRDVQVLLDWVAGQAEAQTDAPGDPRVGMVGASYGGGIQLTTAAIDCRVDAIVPNIAWHSLETSLYPAETVNSWAGFLAEAAVDASLDPHITHAAEASATGEPLSDDDIAWFAERGPSDLVDQIDVPALFVHGTVDTLFTLDEAITNHNSLHERDVPTGMVWFCGGHGTCLTEPGDLAPVSSATLAWLDHYVKGDESADVGAAFSTIDQHGTRWTADTYPPETDDELTGVGDGTLALVAEGGAGPIEAPEGSTEPLAGLVAPFTTDVAENAVDVSIETGEVDGMALGAPRLELTYAGTTPEGELPTRVFAQLVDDETGLVLGNQVTPIEVVLDGETHTAEVDLEVVAHLVEPGQSLTLQVVAATVAYATPRFGGTIDFAEIAVTIPVTEALTEA